MVATRAQAMANESMDKLEENVKEIQTQLRGLGLQIQEFMSKGKEQAHEEVYNGHECNDGESSHSPHI